MFTKLEQVSVLKRVGARFQDFREEVYIMDLDKLTFVETCHVSSKVSLSNIR